MTREELMETRGEEVCEHCVEIGNYQAIMNGLECYGQICQDTQDNFAIKTILNWRIKIWYQKNCINQRKIGLM